MEERTLGEVAYTAYGNAVEWKNFQGGPMPPWHEQVQFIRDAWEAAARAVADQR